MCGPVEFRFQSEDAKPLRCDLCSEQVGVYFGDEPPDPNVVVSRCYSCAATEEAEAITKGAAGDA